MKWLIYLLLLVNISLFAWHYRTGVTPPPSREALPADVQQLVLRSEQQEGSATERPWCYSLGPLDEPQQASALSKRLQQWSRENWQRKSQEARRQGYWVLLPPLASRAEARQAVKALKAKNITDYFLIATGENANGVSLGVFSSFEAAQRRLNQLEKLGFEARWEKVGLPVEEYWLDWWRAAGSLSAEQLDQLQETHPGLSQIERQCEPPENAPPVPIKSPG